MEKTYEYKNGTVTVHGLETWSSGRIAPILAGYVAATINGKEEEGNAA